jgi:nicotinate-nucleotide adenylyltransferase
LIIGEDNLESFPRWKNHETIIENFGLYVYPRPSKSKPVLSDHKNVKWVEAPILDISATFIRNLIKQGKSIEYLTPDPVAQLIKARKIYI